MSQPRHRIPLRELEAEFLRLTSERSWQRIEDIERADGLLFLCPLCYIRNNGKVGTHAIICWRPRVAKSIEPGPGRWEFQGTSLDDLTLVAGSSSILLKGGCAWHGFVRNGHAEEGF